MCGNILLVKGSYYGRAYVMYNEIKYRHKGESNIWMTIITVIYYIGLSVVIFICVRVKFLKFL